MELQEKEILFSATNLYETEGVRSVTMDDVASHMGISKKTLYKYVANKAELVDRAFRHLFYQITEQISQIAKGTENAIEEMINIDNAMGVALKPNFQCIFQELKKYYPETYQFLISERKKFVFDLIQNNLRKGIDQGIYQKDLLIDIISQLYYGKVLIVHEEGVFNNSTLQPTTIFKENLKYHIRGIATPKGLEQFEKLMNKK